MIVSEIINAKIVDRVQEVLAVLGRGQSGFSVRQITFARGEGTGGQHGLSDPAGTWEITLGDGSTYSLPLTFEEMYDAGSAESEKLKAAIMRCLPPRPSS